MSHHVDLFSDFLQDSHQPPGMIVVAAGEEYEIDGLGGDAKDIQVVKNRSGERPVSTRILFILPADVTSINMERPNCAMDVVSYPASSATQVVIFTLSTGPIA